MDMNMDNKYANSNSKSHIQVPRNNNSHSKSPVTIASWLGAPTKTKTAEEGKEEDKRENARGVWAGDATSFLLSCDRCTGMKQLKQREKSHQIENRDWRVGLGEVSLNVNVMEN